MKIAALLIFIIPILVACGPADDQQDSGANLPQPSPIQSPVSFTRGVSFTKWFGEFVSADEREVNRYVEQDFANVKKLGVDVIRLPISFNLFTSSAPDYVIDPLFLEYLDKAVDWAEKYQIYIILDNHPHWIIEPEVSKDYRNFLIPVLTQMAEHYKNRSEYVIYEIRNEPDRSIFF